MSRRLYLRIFLISIQLTGCGLGGGVLQAELTADAEASKPAAAEVHSGPRRAQENMDAVLSCSL
jgi:hypothetical protein